MQHLAPLGQRGLVGGEDDRALSDVPVVDDVEEDVGGVGTVGQVADLIDDQHMGLRVGGEGSPELPVPAGVGEVVNELGRSDEAHCEAVLDGLVPDGDSEMCLSAAGFPLQDQVSAFGDQLGAKVAAEEGKAKTAL